jgi:RNA polymerase sigma-70 factor, ECF subfamily
MFVVSGSGSGTGTMHYLAHISNWNSPPPTSDVRDDSAAIRSAQLGDRDTFVQLIAAYDATVFRLAWNFTQSASAATDIYEAVFTTAYRLLPSYKGEESFLVWLFRIATRCCLTYRSPLRSMVHDVAGPDESRIPIRLRQALMQLTVRDRLVFILRHELQFKAATIARMLSTDEHTVQCSLTRAFLLLRTAARGIATRQ